MILAERIVTQLNSHNYDGDLVISTAEITDGKKQAKAEFSEHNRVESISLNELTVWVTFLSMTEQPANRSCNDDEVELFIFVMRKFERGNVQEIDDLLYLRQQVKALAGKLGDEDFEIRSVGRRVSPYDPEHAKANKFVAYIPVTFGKLNNSSGDGSAL